MLLFVLTKRTDETFLVALAIKTNIVEFLSVGFALLVGKAVGLLVGLWLLEHGVA